ncbi:MULTISPECIES: ATP-binding protein [unclassified Myroides]|uniref:ATP-binding protein n=1 Tax=unclassified Myroides TaxID=2642485 RepID=UPI003D2F81EF
MKNQASINDTSIESAGIPKDYKEAIAELIWNGYAAKATWVNIKFDTNEIDTINSLTISDNGEGIDYGTLNQTFGAFLDSQKRNSFQRSSYTRGKKGKGRYSFATLAGKATWKTACKQDGKTLAYDIVISKNSKHEYEDLNKKVYDDKPTGTDVILDELFGVTAYHFDSEEFVLHLVREFGWFLFLNKDNDFSLCINDTPINYQSIIAESDIRELSIKDNDNINHKFLVTYIRWNESIGDKYYYYFLNGEKRESAKKLTSYNNNAIDFHHSVFVESQYFDSFVLDSNDSDENIFNRNQTHIVFKTLIKDLNEFLFRKQKDFVRENAANDLVLKYESKGVFPKFGKNDYEQARKQDLITVVKELYCVQPKIFKGLKSEQEVTFIGFLNLLLDTDERENIITIIENVTRLTSEEREELSKVLKKTGLSKITETIKLIDDRYKVVELLKTLTFDLKKFTTERNHIQKVIEENYWMFGEQYHLTSADRNFEELLSNYLYIIDGITEKQEINSYDWKRRPDIFACRKRNIPDTQDEQYQLEENILIELKRPTVPITKTEFRQIDDYLDFILKEDRFNSQLRNWKFYVISNQVDDYIKKQYEAFRDKGKRFLVQQAGRYEIYALTWDDLFRTFEIKHQYLLDKLDFDKKVIQDELKIKGISLNRDSSDSMTTKIIEINQSQ